MSFRTFGGGIFSNLLSNNDSIQTELSWKDKLKTQLESLKQSTMEGVQKITDTIQTTPQNGGKKKKTMKKKTMKKKTMKKKRMKKKTMKKKKIN
jgi:hypothetical protein